MVLNRPDGRSPASDATPHGREPQPVAAHRWTRRGDRWGADSNPADPVPGGRQAWPRLPAPRRGHVGRSALWLGMASPVLVAIPAPTPTPVALLALVAVALLALSLPVPMLLDLVASARIDGLRSSVARSAAAKRGLDVVVALGLGLVVLPLLALIAIAVWATMGRPVLYRQSRPGLHARTFTILKFRSMRDAVGPDGLALPDAARLTRFGRFLRRSSLDELPQLWNVLRGDLSLVGPRPQLADYLPRYTPWQQRRHDVMPGITGWAQVNGRNAIGWDERFALDVWYVDNRSLWLDVRILARTVRMVLSGHGVAAPGEATMAPFPSPVLRPAPVAGEPRQVPEAIPLFATAAD